MKKENKKKSLLDIQNILKNNEIIYLIDISGLNSNQIFFLRKSFNENEINMKIIKNSLLKKSIIEKNKKLKSFIPLLKGNTSILFSNKNFSGRIISKIIKNFHIKEGIEKPILKTAYVQELFYFGNKDLNLLLNIKSKEELIVDIIYMLKFPLKEVISSISQITNNKLHNILMSIPNFR